MNEKEEQALQAKLDNLIISNKDQADYAKRTWVISLISGISIMIVCLVMIMSLIVVGPKINGLLTEAQTSLAQVNGILTQVDSVLNQVQDTLDATDVPKLSKEINELIEETRTDVGTTFENISKIDFEGLNTAIKNLSDVIEPLSRFFGMMR